MPSLPSTDSYSAGTLVQAVQKAVNSTTGLYTVWSISVMSANRAAYVAKECLAAVEAEGN